MNENDNTKDLTDNLTDRQLLLELRQAVGALAERLTEVERRTNPLPPNYDARFAALEQNVRGINLELRGIREDLERERKHRFGIEDRLAQVEALVA